jgi:NTP pyrophosphatase (non-canonical NTP hydrolase)
MIRALGGRLAMEVRLALKIRSALYELQEDVHRTATEKGWHAEPRSLGEEIALMHSELSEALEEVRDSNPHLYYRNQFGEQVDQSHSGTTPHKTEGVAAELADVIIRILDTAEERNIPVVDALLHKMEYNKTRPYRHGNKAL